MIKIGEIRLGGLRAEGAAGGGTDWWGRRQAGVQANVDAGGQKRRRTET